MVKIQAKVILAKCPYAKKENLFGIRIQKFGSDWKRTWAFEINEDLAGHEGYDKENINGTFDTTEEYPGCPYCHALTFARCNCGKIFCFSHKSKKSYQTIKLTCPWCNQTGEYSSVETLDLAGGGF